MLRMVCALWIGLGLGSAAAEAPIKLCFEDT